MAWPTRRATRNAVRNQSLAPQNTCPATEGWVIRRSWWSAIGLGIGLALAHFSIALAHALLISSVPDANSLYGPESPPTEVTLTFSEEVSPELSAIRVLNQSGETVDNGDTRIASTERTILSVSLKPLPRGVYTVSWKALSAVDGHPGSGAYTFSVGVAAPLESALSTSGPATGSTWPGIGARWLTLTGQVILLGLFTFRIFVWASVVRASNAEERQLDWRMGRQAIRVGWAGLACVAAGLVLTLIAQREAVGEITLDTVSAWLGTWFGRVWVVRFWLMLGMGFALADIRSGIAAGHRLRAWEWWAGLAIGVALGLTSSMVSHSAALQPDRFWAVAADSAHLLVAGVWVGGLVQLVLAIRLMQTLSDDVRARVSSNLILNFSAMAAFAVGLLLVSGGYLAWQHIGSWPALFETLYGRILVVKLALAIPAFAVASLNLLIIKPRLSMAARDSDPAESRQLHKRFGRLALVETCFALAVVAAAGALTDFQRGRDALVVSQQTQLQLVQSVDDLQASLTLKPGLWGKSNVWDVYLVGADGRPVADARQVLLRFNFLDLPLGTIEVSPDSQGDGHYRAQGSYLNINGKWKVSVVIRRPNAFDSYATFQVETTTDRVIRSLDTPPEFWGRVVSGLSQSGGWSTGGALVIFAMGWGGLAWKAARKRFDLVFLLVPGAILLGLGVFQLVEAYRGPVVDEPNDPAALTWLAESDAAMNQLASVKLLQTTRGDSDRSAVITETVSFQAPDMFHDLISNGSENIAQGPMYYYRDPGTLLWRSVRQTQPFAFPNFDFGNKAVSAKLGKIESVGGRPAQLITFVVYFVRKPVQFTRWIDVETKLILQEYMNAPGHHMLSRYDAYNEPVVIDIPSPSEIAPTPTVRLP